MSKRCRQWPQLGPREVATASAATEEAFLSLHASNSPSACNRHVASLHDSPGGEELDLQSAGKLDKKATQGMTAYGIRYMLNLLFAPASIHSISPLNTCYKTPL